MRRSLYPIAAAAVAVLSLAADIKPAEALVVYPWCAHYGGRMGGAPNCGFVTYAQCIATISGLGGSCMENPWYEPGPYPRDRGPRRRQG